MALVGLDGKPIAAARSKDPFDDLLSDEQAYALYTEDPNAVDDTGTPFRYPANWGDDEKRGRTATTEEIALRGTRVPFPLWTIWRRKRISDLRKLHKEEQTRLGRAVSCGEIESILDEVIAPLVRAYDVLHNLVGAMRDSLLDQKLITMDDLQERARTAHNERRLDNMAAKLRAAGKTDEEIEAFKQLYRAEAEKAPQEGEILPDVVVNAQDGSVTTQPVQETPVFATTEAEVL